MAQSGGSNSMRILRRALAAAAILLLAVIAGFILYAHFRAQKFLAALPQHMGVNITQETNGFTYSQSVRGRTVFTVHAAKEVQRSDGKVTLHDVGIVLYGLKGDRADRIHGNQFEYDQKNGVMSAVGDVYIDLAAPAGQPANPPHPASPERPPRIEDDARVIHLHTTGLTFRQSDRSAETAGMVDFRAGGIAGQAVGASYDSSAGVVVLRSAVKLSGIRNDRPMVLTATRAELDQNGNIAVLETAQMTSSTDSGAQTVAAEHAVVHLAPDGTPQRIDAHGGVKLTGGGAGVLTAQRLEMELNHAGEPKSAHLDGGVRFANDSASRHEQGSAQDLRVAFDAEGRPIRSLMTGAVQMDETAGVSQRSLRAERLDLALAGGGRAPVTIREAQATDAAGVRLRLVDSAGGKNAANRRAEGVSTTDLKADVLKARFTASGRRSRLAGLDGTGRTSLERSLADAAGAVQWKESGTGDSLTVDLREGPGGRSEIARVEQRGAVRITRQSPPRAGSSAGKASSSPPAGAMEEVRAQADASVFDAGRDLLTLTGQVRLSDSAGILFADRVEMDRASGDATADGAVKGSYVAGGGQGEPIHVLAARAVAHKASGVTEFTSATGARVRMWQGGSTLEAPVIDLDRARRTVTARDLHGTDASAVRAVLVGSDVALPDSSPRSAGRAAAPIRVVSREMTYTDALRQVRFSGGVRIDDSSGTVRAQEAEAYLAAPAATGNSAAAKDAAGFMGGKVDRMTAQGAVQIDQPGRKATGDRILYTAADRTFLLTGTRAAPPRLVDDANGSVTGASLRFRSGDDSVEVSGGDDAGRVRSETRIKR